MPSWLAALLMTVPSAVEVPRTPYAAKYASAGRRCASGQEKACRELLRVALEDTQRLERLGAASWLQDQLHLAELATRAASADVRALAVSRLDDQALLARIASEDGNEFVRLQALAKLREPSLIAQLARSDPSENVRSVAVYRLSDPGLLHQIFRHDPSPGVRAAALSRIDDPLVLAEVATSDPSLSTRLAAAKRLRDPGPVTELARHAALAWVREAAVWGVTDEGVLAEIARGDAAAGVRRAAVLRLRHDVTVLADVVRNDPEESVRREALRLLRDRPQADESILAEVAVHDCSPWLRAQVLYYVTDKTLVGRIAREDASPYVRKAAVAFVDRAVLAEVALHDREADVRKAALERLARDPGLRVWLASEPALSKAVDDERQALERASRRYPATPVLGGGYGSTTGLFATAGVRVFESHSPKLEGQSWVLAAEAGRDGGRLKLGYALPSSKVGLGANAFAVRDWRASSSAQDQSFLGAELDLSLAGPPGDLVHGRVGVMSPVAAFGRRPTMTWAVSVELPPLVELLGGLVMPCIGCR